MPTTASSTDRQRPGGEVVVVFGGRSEIGLAVARRLAPGRTIVLASRPGGDVSAPVAALRAAGATGVESVDFDADDLTLHAGVVDEIESRVGPVDIAVLAFGILGDQEVAERDAGAAAQILHTDFVAQAALLTVLAERMKSRRSGVLVAFSSVAGHASGGPITSTVRQGRPGRFRIRNGGCPARHRRHTHHPAAGFVIGRMTAGMDPAPFSSTPEQVAAAVVDRVVARRAGVVWIPWQLR